MLSIRPHPRCESLCLVGVLSCWFRVCESPLGRVLRGASCTCGAAACYSPTPCRVQYHRRARPWCTIAVPGRVRNGTGRLTLRPCRRSQIFSCTVRRWGVSASDLVASCLGTGQASSDADMSLRLNTGTLIHVRAGHGLADILPHSRICRLAVVRRGECAAELVVYRHSVPTCQRGGMSIMLLRLCNVTGACLDTHRDNRLERTPDPNWPMGAEGTATDREFQSAFDLAADTYAIDELLATIDAAFHPTDCGEIIPQTIVEPPVRSLMVFAVLGPSSANTSSTALDFTNASTLRSSRLGATMRVTTWPVC